MNIRQELERLQAYPEVRDEATRCLYNFYDEMKLTNFHEEDRMNRIHKAYEEIVVRLKGRVQ